MEIHRKCKYSHVHPNINTPYTVATVHPGQEIAEKLPTFFLNEMYRAISGSSMLALKKHSRQDSVRTTVSQTREYAIQLLYNTSDILSHAKVDK